jgi:catechol 2,3-dioxygenase-like lactoylglutathione lyase family enzyme
MSPAPAGAAAGTSGGQSSPGLAPAKPKFQFGSSAAAQSSATGAAPASNEQAQAQAPKFQFGTAAASDASAASAGSQAAVTANLQFGTSSGSGTLGGKAVAGGDAASLKFQFGGAGSGAGVGAEGAKAEAGTAKFQFGSAQAATAAQLGAQNSAAPAPAPAVGSTAGGAPGIRFGSSSSSSSSSTSSSSESGDDGPIIFPRAKSGEADATPGGGAAPLPAFSFGVSSTAKATPVPAASFGENRPQSAATADHPGHMFGGVGSKGGRAIAALPSFARATPRLMGYSLVSSDLAATAAFLSDELGMRCVRHDVMSQTLDADGKGGWTRSLFKFSASSELSACVEVVSSPELDGLALAPDGVILTAISSRAHEEMARRGRSVVADGGVHASVPGSSCSVVVYPGMKGFEELADVGLQVPDVEEVMPISSMHHPLSTTQYFPRLSILLPSPEPFVLLPLPRLPP